MSKVKVLVFPCGSENANEIYQALRYSVHVELFGASSIDDCGKLIFDQYIGGLPNINNDEFDNVFASIIKKLGIDVVFATHDTVIDYLSTKAKKMGFYLVNGDETTTAITRRKSLTYQLFGNCEWIPKVFSNVEQLSDFPVIIKPDMGQGGQNIILANSQDDVQRALDTVDLPLVVEYLSGEEITVDCFTDRHQNVIFIAPRTRERVKAGITMRSQFLELTQELENIAKEINRRLTLRGAWFFQMKLDKNGNWKLLEICCRIAGTMVAQRARGANLPLMVIQDYLERELVILSNSSVTLIERNIQTHTQLNFDYDTVFIDFDETLIIDGYAVPQVLAFLYQEVKKDKKIKLITRHKFDILETLKHARIGRELFDEIIQIDDESPKSNYVTKSAIFIDNHFPERLDVFLKHSIPVFDVDALEFFTT
jgi:hypothetical protein